MAIQKRQKPIDPSKYVRLYQRATYEQQLLGRSWYPNAQDEIKKMAVKYRWKYTTDQIAGVVAAISPGLNWELNLEQADLFLYDQTAIVGVYGKKNRDKARQILSGTDPLTILGGEKVRSFYLALTGHQVPVIDRHMIRAIKPGATESYFKPKKTAYLKYADALIKAAKILGRDLLTVQATIWLVIRFTTEWRSLK